MARTNLKKMQQAIKDVADGAIARLAKEREIDSSHIEAHAEASQAQLERLTTEEARLLAAIEQNRAAMNAALDDSVHEIKSLFADMRAHEGERLRSLKAHADDINDDGEVIEAPPKRRAIAASL
jgi:uncharacterized protein YicC (UPF0701 family)